MLTPIRQQHTRWESYKARLKSDNILLYWLVDLIETVVVAFALALMIRHFVVQTSLVPTGSMIPTMMVGDRLFVNKFIYRFSTPHRGDIVVFKSPYKDKKDYVKRCIGLPGETIEIKRGVVYSNDIPLVLPGINVQEDYSYYGPTKVPTDNYFMLGDNRDNSSDSRVWGFVPKEDLLGKAFFTFWPFSRMQVLR